MSETLWFVAVILVAVAVLVLSVAFLFAFIRFHQIRTPGPIDIKKKHVLITGGSSGIGKSLAEIFVRRDQAKTPKHITIIARNLEKLEETEKFLESIINENASHIAGHECQVHIFSCDVTDEKKVEQTIQEAWDIAPIDVAVLSAGESSPLYFHDLKTTDFRRLMDINYMGVVHCIKALVPRMSMTEAGECPKESPERARGGRIVIVSSQVGLLGMFGYSAYAPTKFAVRGLAECLLPELRPFNIHLSVSYPPDTDTAMYEEEMKHKPEECRKMSESGKVFSAEYVAQGIADTLEKKYQFNIGHGFDGKVLNVLGGALSPPSSALMALGEAVSLPLLRLFWTFGILPSWFSIAFQHAPKRGLPSVVRRE